MSKLPIFNEQQQEEPSSKCSSSPTINVVSDSNNNYFGSKFMGRAAVVTLGCAKNHVDSEIMLGVLRNRGFDVVSEVKEADVVVVNTCGFLQSAVKESIDCILDIAELKKRGRLRRLVVAGCAVDRYSDPNGKYGNMKEALPEVDSFISVHDLMSVADAASGNSEFEDSLSSGARPYFLYDDTMPRQLATKRHTAYVKISEGCNRPCAFCIIPKIRGDLRSRGIDSVLREVEQLASLGVKEINLVAQDLTSYGLDGKASENSNKRRLLVELLKKLDQQAAVDWVRLLYAYPIGTDLELIKSIEALPRVCEYLDIPLQHSHEDVLRAMKRPIGKYSARNLVNWISKEAPKIALRTTFIVGFPGETEQHIQDLEAFVSEGYFSSVGVFTYSPEIGTPAYDMQDQVPERIKRERRERIMQAQQNVVSGRLAGLIGEKLQVLVEGNHEDTDMLLTGRARFQAPEVDGVVIINEVSEGSSQDRQKDWSIGEISRFVGSLVEVEIAEVAGYDLVGKIVCKDYN